MLLVIPSSTMCCQSGCRRTETLRRTALGCPVAGPEVGREVACMWGIKTLIIVLRNQIRSAQCIAARWKHVIASPEMPCIELIRHSVTELGAMLSLDRFLMWFRVGVYLKIIKSLSYRFGEAIRALFFKNKKMPGFIFQASYWNCFWNESCCSPSQSRGDQRHGN